MGNSFEANMRELLVLRSSTALGVASSLAGLADPTSEIANSPAACAELRNEMAVLEAQTCAVLRQGGVSWDALAGFYGVTKQSLHRRLAGRVDQAVVLARDYSALHEEDLRMGLSFLAGANRRLRGGLERKLDTSAELWGQRRKAAGWWWELAPE
ncbi:hypothetical protein [Streptomyces sp. NBC_01443]|uniref:hypothetical protein n=1 Tax=Streptomyces sp. NBC_01443 TaxID=2903868 RepID=UPI00225A8D8D|nr:hypothetical protein [Streptomyces sp. NBC_01443]MCX4628913.1 hypothetical protein [Streptomyces sp. NBC_01443]